MFTTGLPIEKEIELRKAYMNVFNGEDGKKVLEDLESRCFSKTTTITSDSQQVNNANEGKRMTLLHINSMKSKEEFVQIERGVQ